jgi:YfiH family protein
MEITKAGKVHYLEPRNITTDGMIVAGFTTRHEGVSRPPYNSLNLGANTLDPPHNVKGNRSLLARACGTRLEKLVTVEQVHGTDLLVIDSKNQDLSHFLKLECDGIVTNQPGVMIAIGVADCVPILLFDPVKRVIAALHAGWKGTAGNIVAKGVEALCDCFETETGSIKAAIGPAIGPCCYEVDEPVRDAFRKSGLAWEGCATPQGTGKWGLDLKQANRMQLLAAGVLEGNIETASHCVSCNPDLFFSYRRDQGETGRHLGFIMLQKR